MWHVSNSPGGGLLVGSVGRRIAVRGQRRPYRRLRTRGDLILRSCRRFAGPVLARAFLRSRVARLLSDQPYEANDSSFSFRGSTSGSQDHDGRLHDRRAILAVGVEVVRRGQLHDEQHRFAVHAWNTLHPKRREGLSRVRRKISGSEHVARAWARAVGVEIRAGRGSVSAAGGVRHRWDSRLRVEEDERRRWCQFRARPTFSLSRLFAVRWCDGNERAQHDRGESCVTLHPGWWRWFPTVLDVYGQRGGIPDLEARISRRLHARQL